MITSTAARLASMQRSRLTWQGAGLGLLLLAAIVPIFLNAVLRFDGVLAVVYALDILSLVVLTGFVGQISLCQATFSGVSAFTVGMLVQNFGWNFWPATLLGVVAAAVIGVLVGIPALRLRGILLAIVTIGVALSFEFYIFNDSSFAWFNGGVSGWAVGKTSLGPLTLDNRPSNLLNVYWVLLLLFAAIAVLVSNLHDSGAGRKFRAIRDSELAASTMGVDLVRYKLVAFGLSAAIAGVAGAFFTLVIGRVSSGPFGLTYSLQFAAFAVLMGIRFIPAAAIGGFFLSFVPTFLTKMSDIVYHDPTYIKGAWFNVFLGAVLIVQVIAAPDGVWGQVRHSLTAPKREAVTAVE